jgi:hypothetical protein
MALAAGTAASTAAPKINAQQEPITHHMPMEEAPPLPLQPDEEHFVPHHTLEAKWKVMTLDGVKVKVRAYNDQIPGPPICVQAGTSRTKGNRPSGLRYLGLQFVNPGSRPNRLQSAALGSAS